MYNYTIFHDHTGVTRMTKLEPKEQLIFDYIKDALNIKLMDDPFEYVKNLQEDFPYEKIPFSDEYYDCTGRERP